MVSSAADKLRANVPAPVLYHSDREPPENARGARIIVYIDDAVKEYLSGSLVEQRPSNAIRAWFASDKKLRLSKPRKISTSLLLQKFTGDTRWHSSVSFFKKHPAYPELVSQGRETADLILRQMAKGETHVQWFPLLKNILAIDPVLPQNRGKTKLMAADWIRWARDNSLLDA